MITIIQGESFPIPVMLQKNGEPIGPDSVTDCLICVAEIHKKHSDGTLAWNEERQMWNFFPAQSETYSAEPGFYNMQIQIKHKDGTVQKVVGPYVNIQESPCKEKL